MLPPLLIVDSAVWKNTGVTTRQSYYELTNCSISTRNLPGWLETRPFPPFEKHEGLSPLTRARRPWPGRSRRPALTPGGLKVGASRKRLFRRAFRRARSCAQRARYPVRSSCGCGLAGGSSPPHHAQSLHRGHPQFSLTRPSPAARREPLPPPSRGRRRRHTARKCKRFGLVELETLAPAVPARPIPRQMSKRAHSSPGSQRNTITNEPLLLVPVRKKVGMTHFVKSPPLLQPA